MILEDVCKKTCETVKFVAKFIQDQKDKIQSENIEKKGTHDFVTYVDKTAESMIIDELKKIVPSAGFIAEEGTNNFKADQYNWIIDPLDGTTNYIHGLSPYAISIALMEKNEAILGVVLEISHNECFYAYKNSKAYLNGKEISVSKCSTLENSLISTGFPYRDYSKMEQYISCLQYFMEHTSGIRRHGSAATDLAYVACGRFDAFFEYALSPWDVAAGAFIVKQAGGIVSDFSGSDNYIFGKEIIASNKNIYPKFFTEIKNKNL